MSAAVAGHISASTLTNSSSKPALVRSLLQVSSVISWLNIGTGILVLAGWWLNLVALTAVRSGLATMKPITALAFVLVGGVLWLRRNAGDKSRKPIAAHMAGITVVVIGASTLVEYIFGLDLGIDSLLFHRALTSTGAVHMGRMAPATALAFVILGSAVLLLDVDFRRKARPAEWLAIAAGLIGFIALLGYLYGVEDLYRVSAYSSMAVHTATLFVLLALGTLFARPDRGLTAVITSRHAGGALTRRLLPVVIVLPVALGWLRLQGQRLGWYGTEFGLALFACVSVVTLVATVWMNGIWLNRADIARHQVLDSIFSFVGLVSVDGILLEANRAPLEVAGLKLEDVVGKPLSETFWFSHSASSQRRIQNALRRAAAGEIVRYDEVIRAAGDQRLTIDVTFSPVRDKSGKVVQIVGSGTDISLRKQAEAELKESEERRRLALDAAHMGTFDWDMALNRITWSRVHGELWGFRPDEFQGTYESFASRIHPADLAAMNSEIARCAGSREPFSSEFRVVWPDGSLHWVLGRGDFAFNDAGNAVRMRGVVMDITERKVKEQAIRQSEERFPLFVEHAPAQLAMFDREMRYLHVSRRWRIDYGLGDRDLRGVSHYEVFPEIPENWREAHRRGLAGALQRGENDRFERADGSVQWIRWEIRPWHDSTGEIAGIVIFTEDMTETNRKEEALRRRTEQLRALSTRLQRTREEERIKVARELHDQIGQALTALKMDVTWLAKHVSVDKDDVRERVHSALAVVADGVQWVRKICTELRPGVLDDLGLAAAIEWQAKEFSARTGIRTEVDVPAHNLELDDDQSTAIFRIFQEALTNVVRHAAAREVRVLLQQQNGKLVLVVQDDGKGIHEVDTNKSLGVLGMKERAQACGGEVQISALPGRGTQVLVLIPLRAA